jgi:glycerol-3-phosphate dehydrogenase
MVVPIHDGAQRGPLLIRAGMILYDALSFDKSLPRHSMLSSKQAIARVPALDPNGLEAAAIYYDAQAVFAERLVIENVRSATDHGARVATRAKVRGIIADGAVVRGVEVEDALTGEMHRLSARIVVNVAGPWVDAVLAGAPEDRIKGRLIGGTKGSHIVVDRFAGAPDDAIYYESRTDRRPILVIPFNGMIMLGSTDLRYEGDLDRVETSDAEIAYLLGEANALFSGINLAPEDVRYSYAGVRPLPYSPSGSTASITRRHVIKDHAPVLHGLWSIIGGKLTTHRALAEAVVTRAARALDHEAPCETAATPLPGAAGLAMDGFRAGLLRQTDAVELPGRVAARLADVYGRASEEILAIVQAKPELGAEVDAWSGAIAAEAVYAVGAEMAGSLADILLRRTMIAYGPHAGIGPDETVLTVAGKELGWDKNRQATELHAFREWITRYRPRNERERVKSEE